MTALATQTRSNRISEVTPDTMIPALLAEKPHLRAVLDRYGLQGCGGWHGPAETIDYFARIHGVEMDRLLQELRTADKDPIQSSALKGHPEAQPFDNLADTICRRFFKAGIVVVLTAGAAWGALLLLRIASSGSFTAISIHEVNAHGHAQIFGWVGLFVMGFAYQAFPRMKHTHLWQPRLANITFYLMVFGVFARAIGEPFHGVPLLKTLAILSGGAEILAIALFVVIVARTLHFSRKPFETHEFYIVTAMVFFLVQAVYEIGLVSATMTASSRDALLTIVSTYQGALRDLQIHGFAMLMILGVGLRMFPALWGFHRPSQRFARVALVLLASSVVGEAISLILMRRTGNHMWAAVLYPSVLVLAGLSIALTFRWGLLARPTKRHRSTKFVRAAIYWLHTSMILLVLAPLYMYVLLPGSGTISESGRRAIEMGFSHAYYGAVRHAITVGFISLTILGMAAQVVPTLNGVDIRSLRPLWLPFVLVNLGCMLRVSFQIATDFGATAYSLVGISGLCEVTGIAVWGNHLWRLMRGREPLGSSNPTTNRR